MKIPGTAKIWALWDSLRTSYWFVPTLMAVGAVLLWVAAHALDLRLADIPANRLSWIYTGGPEGARELLGVVAGSMITVAGVTFSITIVALTLASQQFGPFLLRNFLRDTGNQVALGAFISTFIFCLLTLRMVRGTESVTYVPHISVTVGIVMTFVSLGVLIYFIHHVSMSIQVSNILSVVSRDLQAAIDRIFPDRIGRGAEQSPESVADRMNFPDDCRSSTANITSTSYGYLKAVDDAQLLSTAIRHDLVVRLLKRPGDFVGQGDGIADVISGGSVGPEAERAIREAFLLGSQRTATQDVGFVMDQIVEVAVRALSPGINDPFTALICIDHLGQGLRRMATRDIPTRYRLAEDGALRVIADPVTFSELAHAAFAQIRDYGRSSPPVLMRLLDTISAIAPHLSREEDRQALLHQAVLVREVAVEGLREKAARFELEESYIATLSILEQAGAPALH
ncbi:DUF2254 domain-containing protein [Geoanaerobacter pelophilus]|nr:DUF2254 domain-containing protein [Geoanaerobacter pelophilus]